MEFLVRIDINLPADLTEKRRDALLADERARGLELIGNGAIGSIWRIPGKHANVGIWVAPDATALDDLLGSLPLRPWMAIEVIALADHPLRRLP